MPNNNYTFIPVNDSTYRLKINGELCHKLYEVIQKMLKSSYLEAETNTLLFSAEKVVPFQTYLLTQPDKRLSYARCVHLIDDLSKQMMYLNKNGYGFYGFNVGDILTIDNSFFFCSAECLLPLWNDCFLFTAPIKQPYPYFANPELFKLTKLPAQIHYKCGYYSLGVLVVLSLLHVYLLVGNDLKTAKEMNDILEPIRDTKMFWFLKRCMNDDIHQRQLLLV